MKRLHVLVAAFAVAACAFVPVPGSAGEVPKGATWTETWFPSGDGTMLRADVLLPKDRRPHQRFPVVLAIGPYFGRNPLNGGDTGPVMRFADFIVGGDIFERGYAWVQVDSRGYGGSDGCNDFGGPGEQSDVESAVNWAAAQPWSTGNVGMWGKSYDAWTQVMALAENPVGLKAAVIQSPLIETYRGMFLNGVHYDAGWYGTPSLYGGYDLAPTTATDSAPEAFLYPAKGTATNPHCYAQNVAFTTQPDHSLEYWRQRDIVRTAARSDVPVLWSHGFNDANTKPDNFLPVFSRLQGPKRAWIGQWDHVRGNEWKLVGRRGFLEEALEWFDRYLKGESVPTLPAIEVQNGEGWWRSEDAWPPADARRYALPLRSGSYMDDGMGSARSASRGTWTFTQRAPYDMHLAGTPRLSVYVAPVVPFANLVGLLYDVGPHGRARLISRGAFRVEGPAKVTFGLYPQDWVLRAGHRFGVLLNGDDTSWFLPTPTRTEVKVLGGSLSLPFLQYRRAANLEGGPAAAMQGVPVPSIEPATIVARVLRAAFPPRLEQR
jgi:hypothetical protein